MAFEVDASRTQAGIAVARITAGVIFFMHGWQKFFDMGLAQVTGFFGSLGIPLPGIAAPFVSTLELVGGLLLVIGLFARPVAALLALDMLVAMLVVHLANGFYVGDGGVEFTLILMAVSVAVVLAGGGRPSADAVLARKRGSGAGVA